MCVCVTHTHKYTLLAEFDILYKIYLSLISRYAREKKNSNTDLFANSVIIW